MTNRSTAAALCVSENTVSTHLRSAFAKLGVSSRVQLTNIRNEQRHSPKHRWTQVPSPAAGGPTMKVHDRRTGVTSARRLALATVLHRKPHNDGIPLAAWWCVAESLRHAVHVRRSLEGIAISAWRSRQSTCVKAASPPSGHSAHSSRTGIPDRCNPPDSTPSAGPQVVDGRAGSAHRDSSADLFHGTDGRHRHLHRSLKGAGSRAHRPRAASAP